VSLLIIGVRETPYTSKNNKSRQAISPAIVPALPGKSSEFQLELLTLGGAFPVCHHHHRRGDRVAF